MLAQGEGMAKKNQREDGTVVVGVRTQKVSKNLKQFREQAGLKQNELGLLVGHKSGAKVSMWESGAGVPPLELAAELAAHLGVTTSQLLGEAEPPSQGSHVTNNVINGDQHTIYQHVEGGALLMTAELQQAIRTIVEEVVDARCQQLATQLEQTFRQALREAARAADGADPPPPGG
jgi:DNA-binding XRE family transcriptional regulator